MSVYGETETGWRGKTYAEIRESLRSKLRGVVHEDLTLDELDWLGNLVDGDSDELALAWEALGTVRNAFDPHNAEGQLMVALAALTGTNQRAATKGVAEGCLVTLEPNKSFAIGALVAHVQGDPTNRWSNAVAVESDSEGGAYPVDYVAETAGRKLAPAGTLTVQAQTKSGWVSITNPTDAVPGREVETIDELRLRRRRELAQQGSASLSGLIADLSDVDGIIEYRVIANDTDATRDGVPPRTIHVLIWDGSDEAADNDEVAQAIFDSKDATDPTMGDSVGIAVDPVGNEHDVRFDRAEQIELYAELTLKPTKTVNQAVAEALAKQAVVDAMPSAIGGEVIILALKSAPLSVTGVVDVTRIRIGETNPPTGETNQQPASDAIYVLDSSRITITWGNP